MKIEKISLENGVCIKDAIKLLADKLDEVIDAQNSERKELGQVRDFLSTLAKTVSRMDYDNADLIKAVEHLNSFAQIGMIQLGRKHANKNEDIPN